MKQYIFTATEYAKYLVFAKTRHSVHSPLIFSLIKNVFDDKSDKPVFRKIENLRKQLFTNQDKIQTKDFGAGSALNSNKTRKISDIAKNSAKSPKLGKLLHRMLVNYQCQNVLELGTSLGLSGAYLATAHPNLILYTLEGCPETAKIAQKNFDQLGLQNIKLNVGSFDVTLENTLKQMHRIDFGFFDGNHQYQATIHYFHTALQYAHQDSIFVFDDIYWSKGMKKAWLEISKHPSVSHSVDIFHLGIVFFKNNTQKVNFRIRY